MEINDSLTPKGHITIKLFGSDGELKEQREVRNVIVTVGKTYIADFLTGVPPSSTFMPYVGLGSGTSSATAADTNLETPHPTRIQGALTSASNVWQNQASFGPGVNTGTISEAGLFTNGSGGTMFARQVFSAIPKSAGDTIQVTWQVTFS